MTKKKRQKKLKPTKKLTEVEQLRRQVAKLEAQKADLELDNLILKKWLPDIHAHQPAKNQNSRGDSG